MKTYQLVGFDTRLYPYLSPVYYGENEFVTSISNEEDIIIEFRNQEVTQATFISLNQVTLIEPMPPMEVAIGDPAIYAYQLSSQKVLATNQVDMYISVLNEDSKTLSPRLCERTQYFMNCFGPHCWPYDQEASCWDCPFLFVQSADDGYGNEIDCFCENESVDMPEIVRYHDAGDQKIKRPYWCPKWPK